MQLYMATGPDKIKTEIISALEECGIEQITGLLNTIYDSGETPPDLCTSILTAIPKKIRALEFDQHRTVSIISHVTMILVRIIMKRI